MLRRAKIAIAIIGFLALFGFLAFQTGLATKYPQRQSEQSSPAQNHERKNPFERFWEWTTHDPVAFYTSLLALFTLVLGGSTVALWWETRRIRSSAAEDTRTLQRAYISVEPQGVHSINDEVTDQAAIAHIGIENVGNLPARDVRWLIKWEIDQRRYRNIFPIAETEAFGRNTVPPGTKMTQGGERFEFDEGAAAGAEGGPFLYVWGAVYYRDGFDDSPQRITRFCHRYNFENLPSGHVDYFFKPDAARIHRFGNDAD